ncbi:MAG: tetratricopeptide repeat protein, partial [Acidimicrobiia bacterium]|nr:tetratricopeptide repeat protein [Acidimicrobiia bacterium]
MSPEQLVDTGTDALLAAARNHRLTLIVADAGWGKSTFLRRLVVATDAIELSLERTGRTPFGLARALLDGLAQRVPGVSGHELPRHAAPDSPGSPNQTTALAASVAAAAASVLDDIVVVIDDAELAAGDPLERFVEALVLHLPPAVHLVLACRRAPHLRIARLRASGDVLRIGPEELCLSEDDVRILDLPPEARPAVVEIARATGGWPLAIQLATDAVRRSGPLDRAALVDRLLAPDAVLFEYLAEEALASLDGAERDTVALAAHLPHLSVALLDELGRGDLTTAMHRLGSGGTFLERDVDPGRYQATLLGGEFARRVLPMPADTAVRALEAYLRLGRVDAALDLCVRLGDGDLAARVVMAVHDHDRLIVHDNFEMVLRLAEKAGLDALAAERRGDLFVQRGEWDAALASYGRAAMLGDDGDACIARKRAEILYLRGRLDEAEAACRTARLDGSAPGDEAQVLAWLAAIRWVRGDIDGCGELLEPAEAAAAVSGDDAALAAVHTARAMLEALRGDRRANDRWYRRALQHAVRAEDVVQIVRIRSSLGSHHLEQGEYREALAELDTAIELSELAGSDTFAAMAYANRADTYLRMGRLDDALHAGRQAQRIWDRLGSDLVDYALGHLGHVQLLRGQRAEALALFNEAVVRAESRGDVQGLVPGLIGLVRVLVDDDPEAAAA